MNRLRTYLFLLLLITTIGATAQVNVSFTLRPPYSAYLKDYYRLENKAIIILTNTSRTTVDIKLGGSISNVSKGVYIRTTPGYSPAMPITLGPNATVTLTANPDVMRFFDQNNVTTNANDAMLANIIRSGTLPEGNYQICVDAYDYNTGRQLSSRGNGCFNFDISLLDPPVITFPQNNYSYPPEQLNLNFNWTPPLGNLAGSIIEYDQIVVQVEPGQNPNDAIAGARDFNANNPVLNKRNLLSQTYITQPYDLPFIKGKTYAMQVVARDRNQKLLLNNQGRSEIVVFSVGQAGPRNNPELTEQDNSTFSFTQLKGTLRYYWPVQGPSNSKNNFGASVTADGPAQPGGISMQGNNGVFGNTNGGNSNQNNGGSSTGNNLQQSNGNGTVSNGAFIHDNGAFTGYRSSLLAGVTIQLITAIQLINPVANGSGAPALLPGNIMVGSNSIKMYNGSTISLPTLATATSGANGSFAFNVPSLDQFDFSIKQGSFGEPSGEFSWSISGSYRKVLMVKITTQGSAWYADPVKFVSGIPSDKSMGVFYCKVKTIGTTVRVTDNADWNLVKDHVEVLLLRKGNRPFLAPKDEGNAGTFTDHEKITISGETYDIIEKKLSTEYGEAGFPNMLPHPYCGSDWPYYFYVRPQNEYNTPHNFTSYAKPFRLSIGANWAKNGSCYNSQEKDVTAECVQMNCLGLLSATKRYSIAGDDNVYQAYRYQFVTLQKPRIYALVKNAAAGTDNNNAQNEAHANWYLWKISGAGMVKAKAVAAGGKWGLLMESNLAGFNLVKTQLNNNGTPLLLERSGSTGSDGRIDENLLSTQGPQGAQTGWYYILQVVKEGFDPVMKAVNRQSEVNSISGDMSPALYGMAFNLGTLWLKPKGEARFTLVSEAGGPVDGYAYYIDPVTGQSGEAFDSRRVRQNNSWLSMIDMDIPSGNGRKIVIVPSLTGTYARDTFTVNVAADTRLDKTLVIKLNLHRIYFNVRGNNNLPLDKAKVELIMEPPLAVISQGTTSPYLYDGAYSPMQSTPVNPGGNNNNGLQIDNGTGLQPVDGSTSTILQGDPTDTDGNPYTRRTNNGGGVDFAFTSSGHTFKFRISGPDGSSYVLIQKMVDNYSSKTWTKVEVKLPAARTVRGTVKFGQVPIANARVRILGAQPAMEVFTNNAGEYVMPGVQQDTMLTFTASKESSNYVGMTYTEGQGTVLPNGMIIYEAMQQNTATTTINFKLRIYDGLDLSKLLGFPLEVTSLTETSYNGGNGAKRVTISGLVSISDSLNQVFKMTETTAQGKRLNTIDFSNIIVTADAQKNGSNIPYCRPLTLPVHTDINEQSISIHGLYAGKMYDNANGITLNNTGSGQQTQGIAQAKVLVSAASVNDNNFGYLPGQEMFLVNSTNSMQLPVFTSSGAAILNTTGGISIANETGGAFSYKLKYGPDEFTAIAAKNTSRLYKDSIILDTRVQTNLQYITPGNLDLAIGKVKINSQHKLVPMSSVVNQTRALGTFSMKWTKVYLDQSGISFDGMLTAAGMNMPVADAMLYPDRFHIDKGALQTNNVQLLSAVPVTVADGIGASFGYDAVRPTPAWYLSITSEDNNEEAASISGQGLSGIPANSKIPFSSIWFYSEGTQELTLMNNLPSYRLQNITDFSLQSVSVDNNSLTLNGLLELGIPNFPAYNSGLLYEKTGQTTMSEMKLRQFSMPRISMNGIVLDFNGGNSFSMAITPGQLVIKGAIKDESVGVFTPLWYTLTKTNQLTELTVDRNVQQQTIIGAANSRIVLKDVEGKMTVSDTGWSHFYFKGNMPDNMGFTDDGKRVRFDVLGALKVENQSVKLQNVSTDFGGLNMVFDIQKQRMMGQMSFDKKIGTVDVDGHAEIVFDNYGYYFMATGAMHMSNPSVDGTTFMIFGDYDHLRSDRQQAIEALFKQYSYYYQHLHKFPKGYTNMDKLNGFFFEAGAAIPVPGVPNFDIDLGLIEAALEVQVGGDVRVGMNFGNVNSYNLGMGVFIDARFAVGVSFIHFCGGVELQVQAGVDIDGTYYSNDTYEMEVTGFINLEGSCWAGGGLVCDSDCDGLACEKTTASGSVGLRAVGNVTQDHSSFRLEYDTNSFPKKKD